MAEKPKYYPNSTVSRHLPPGERGFEAVLGQSGKYFLDSERNLSQDLNSLNASIQRKLSHTSGWVRTSTTHPNEDFNFPEVGDLDFLPNTFQMFTQYAVLADLPPIKVGFSNINTVGLNLISLEEPSVYGVLLSNQRVDFVFLEVFRAQVKGSPRAQASVYVNSLPSDGDTITIDGVVLTARVALPGVDEFQIGANVTLTATNIVNAINDSGNSFTTVSSARNLVNGSASTHIILSSIDPGAVGNSLTLATSNPLAFILSGATFSGGSDTGNKPAQDKIYRLGNVNSLSGVWLDDDIGDPVVGLETSQRIQIQYRIRTSGSLEEVDFKSEPNGFENLGITAQGTQSSPVSNYPFVKADNSSVSGLSDATAYGDVDPGLWIAGDGSESAATALGTVDGFVYAIPLAFVFRRNDAYDAGSGNGWDPINNITGGLLSTHGGFIHPIFGAIGSGLSDRPDGLFADSIASTDLLDLRNHICLNLNLSDELLRQSQMLMDQRLTSWAFDIADKQVLGAGAGETSIYPLVCDMIGRESSRGGTDVVDGSTNHGVTIRSFDHISRRFGDNPIVERVIFEFQPSYDSVTYPGKYAQLISGSNNGWSEGDTLHLDLTNLSASTLGDYLAPGVYTGGASEFIADFFPTGTVISNVLGAYHNDGDSSELVFYDASVEFKSISGIGTNYLTLVLDPNTTVADSGDPLVTPYVLVDDTGSDNGSQRSILVEVEISYPSTNGLGLGAGATNTPYGTLTPDSSVWPLGASLELSPASVPGDMEVLLPVTSREGYRELAVEYIASLDGANTPITEQVVSSFTNTIILSRRIYGDASYPITVEDLTTSTLYVVDVANTEYGSSSRILKIAGSLPGPNRLCEVTYYAQDPVPQSGGAGAGYQIATYYRTNAPQTVGTSSLNESTLFPSGLNLKILSLDNRIYSNQIGSGSIERGFPYTAPGEQIPVNEGTLTFDGEWEFSASETVSLPGFDVNTGYITLPPYVLSDSTQLLQIESPDKDSEMRLFFGAIQSGSYRPAWIAQGLSNLVRHKTWTFALVTPLTDDEAVFRSGEILLAVLCEWFYLSDINAVRIQDSSDFGCVALYRTQGRYLLPKT